DAGVNYLEACEAATGDHAAVGQALAKGAREVLSGAREEFRLDYATPSSKGDRWYEAQVLPTKRGEKLGIVVFHKDITHRKLAEQRQPTMLAREPRPAPPDVPKPP